VSDQSVHQVFDGYDSTFQS